MAPDHEHPCVKTTHGGTRRKTPLAKLNQQGRQHEKAALLKDGDEKGNNSKLRGALVRRRSLAVEENESAIDNPKCKEKSGTVASGEQTENTAANDVDQTPRLESQPESDSGDSDVEILSEDSCSPAQSSRSSGLTKTRHTLSFLSPPKETDGPKSKTVQSKLFRPTSPSSRGKDGVKENSTFKQVQSSKSSLVLNSSPKGISALVSSQMRNSRSSGVMEKVLSLVPESEEQKSSVSNSPSVRASQFFSSPGGSRQNAQGISSPSGSPLVEKVPCPVCGIPVVSHAVNRHLDMCLASQGKRVSRRSLDKRKSLPKLVYNLLSEKDLRKRLKQLALNSQGDRQTMIKRHHEFTLYFNADCDSLAPKDMSELVKEFEETQKLQKKLSSKSSTSGQSILRFTKDSKKEDVEKANKEYASKNKNQFQSLIQQARSGMRSARQRQATASMSTSTAADPDQAPTQTVASHSETKQTGVSSAADVHLDREEDSDDDGVHSLDKHHSVPSHQADSSTIPHVFTLDTDNDDRMSQDSMEDTGEETGSDVFEYNPDSKSVEKVVPAELKAKSKRALRPSKPTWKDADKFETLSEDSSSSDRSQLDSSLEGSRGASSLNCEVAAVAEVCVSAVLSGKSNPEISQKVPSPEVSQEKSHRDTEVSQPKEKSSLADEPSSKVSHNASLGDRDVTQLIKQSHTNGCSSEASLGDFCNTLPVDPMPESAPRERKRKRACKVPAEKEEEQPKKPKRQKSQSTSSEGADISHADCQNQSQSVSDAEDTSPQKNQEVATETSKKCKVSAKKKTTKGNRSEIVNEACCLLGTSQKDLEASQLHAVQVSTKLATVPEESQEMMEGMSEEEDAGELVSATEEREVGGPTTTTGSFEERETATEDQQRLEGDQQEGGESTEAPLPVPKLKSLLKKKQKSASHHMKSVRFAGLRARVSDIPYLSQQSFSESVEDDTQDDADKECSNADSETLGDMENRVELEESVENRVELEESVENEKEINAEDEMHRGDGGEKGIEVGVENEVHGNADGVHSSCEGRSGGTEEAHTEACVENKGEDDLTKSTQSNMTNTEDKVIMKEQSVEEVCKENTKKKKPAQKPRRRIKVLLRPCMKDEENEFTSMKLSPKSLNHLSSKSKETATASVKPAPKSCDHVSSKSKEAATSSDHKIEDAEKVAALEVEDEPVRTHQRKKSVEDEPVQTHQRKKSVEDELVQTHQRKKPRSRAHENENGRASSSTVTEQTDLVMGKKHSRSKATCKKLTESIPDSSESKGSKNKVTENIPNAENIPDASQSKGSESANNEVTENIPDSLQRHSPKTKQKKHRRNTVADITATENIVASSIVRDKETSSIKGIANSKKRRYTEVEELRYNEERSDDFVEEMILSPADAVKTKQRKARRK
ncbi:uro-adherence factor A-like [Littorina saxatilis]|uniref:uro-adherence factor A-like n=1 Tax=Littorina saxatilis TaxID=31220 RepID=UPI0038B58124